MSKEGNFLIFCMEQYKSVKNLNGKQVSDLFRKYKVYDYIIEDIDLYIEARQAVQ